jgi:hypothetical protein
MLLMELAWIAAVWIAGSRLDSDISSSSDINRFPVILVGCLCSATAGWQNVVATQLFPSCYTACSTVVVSVNAGLLSIATGKLLELQLDKWLTSAPPPTAEKPPTAATSVAEADDNLTRAWVEFLGLSVVVGAYLLGALAGAGLASRIHWHVMFVPMALVLVVVSLLASKEWSATKTVAQREHELVSTTTK